MPGPLQEIRRAEIVILAFRAYAGIAIIPNAGRRVSPQGDLGAGREARDEQIPTERAELLVDVGDLEEPPADAVHVEVGGAARKIDLGKHGRAALQRAGIGIGPVNGDEERAVAQRGRHQRDAVGYRARHF